MRVLLDTHVFLWFILGHPMCSPKIRKLIEDPRNECLVSIVSIWEIGIKHSLGKLPLHCPLEQFFQTFTDGGFAPIPITMKEILVLATLPLHHRDPFDRLLIAQAKVNDLELISADPQFRVYDVRIRHA